MTGRVLPVEQKVEVAAPPLLAAGVAAIEIGSMARPDLVPPMANTVELVESLTPDELEKGWIWVAEASMAAPQLAIRNARNAGQPFSCASPRPFEGRIDPERVIKLVESPAVPATRTRMAQHSHHRIRLR